MSSIQRYRNLKAALDAGRTPSDYDRAVARLGTAQAQATAEAATAESGPPTHEYLCTIGGPTKPEQCERWRLTSAEYDAICIPSVVTDDSICTTAEPTAEPETIA